MSNKDSFLNMDDLPARAREIDSASAEEIVGGLGTVSKYHLKSKKPIKEVTVAQASSPVTKGPPPPTPAPVAPPRKTAPKAKSSYKPR